MIESIHQGELKLSQVTVLQKTLREVKGKAVSKETKSELIESIKNKSVYETQVIVAKALNVEIKQAPKVTPQADESVRLDITLSKSRWEKLNSMRELLSNAVPTGDWSEVLEYLADKVIQQKTGKVRQVTKPSLYQLKKQSLKLVGCCQYKTAEGKICGNHNRHVYRKQANIRIL